MIIAVGDFAGHPPNQGNHTPRLLRTYSRTGYFAAQLRLLHASLKYFTETVKLPLREAGLDCRQHPVWRDGKLNCDCFQQARFSIPDQTFCLATVSNQGKHSDSGGP